MDERRESRYCFQGQKRSCWTVLIIYHTTECKRWASPSQHPSQSSHYSIYRLAQVHVAVKEPKEYRIGSGWSELLSSMLLMIYIQVDWSGPFWCHRHKIGCQHCLWKSPQTPLHYSRPIPFTFSTRSVNFSAVLSESIRVGSYFVRGS